jgi:diguanylate cyclase (GGDEF)-like protein
MLYAPIATKRKRSLVATPEGSTLTGELMNTPAQLRSLRLEALSHFAPLLAGATVLSCFVIVWALSGHESVMRLVAWTMLVIAGNWLVVRRLETNSLLYLRRDPPKHVLIEAGALISLVAALWSSLPVFTYIHQSGDMQIILASAICAMMCGALAIATSPVAATVWASVLAGGLAVALHLSNDRLSLPMTIMVLFQFGFILAVIRRIATLIAVQADHNSRQHGEIRAVMQLMREYEERGTNCLWQTDASHILTYATPGIANLLSTPLTRLMGSPLPALVGGHAVLGTAMLERSAFTGIEVELGNGVRAIALSGTPIIDSAGVFLGFRGACADITETRSSERRLRQLANLDVLTKLPNRMRMRELFAEALLAARASGRPCGILMLDLDGFKPVNDTFGHPKGDAVLKTVAARLTDVVAGNGIVGRFGGDEFAIVLHDTQNRRVFADLGNLLIKHVSEPYTLDGVSVRIGLSIGAAFGPTDGDTVDDLIKKADLALYEAKAAGRGTYRNFEHKMQTEAENRLKLEHDLRLALPLDQLRLYYQPLIHSATQEVMGFEALLRWQHPVRGFVSPAEFVPLAEEVGLIHEIGEWVVRTAIRDCARWPAAITVAVNISPVQLHSPSLPAMISNALTAAKLSANRLELEVTESVFLRDSDGSLDVLRRLRALGVRIALDDFGTGYSSLGYLNRTIFNKLKIDGSFVRGAATRSESISIIQAIVTLANCFQMTITAEGVETHEDYRRMQGLGCHQMQGYLFGRPVPFERATTLVGTRWSGAVKLASA